jgi:MSHA biogenesis protein MshQ
MALGRWRDGCAALACAIFLYTPVQAATQSANPASCASVTGIGSVAWSNSGNALSSNNAHASASVNATITNYLTCTGYGFSIPTGSRIDGITVDVERKSDRTSNGGSNDAAMRIVKGGTIGTADRSSATVYTIADTSEAHGGATDLWGVTWTAADINATNFGAAFAATKPSSNGPTHTITVDLIAITVTYTPPPTVSSVSLASPDPTSAATVNWTITFSEAVSGVNAADFSLVASGLTGSSIASVSGGPTVYTVTANTGFGTGTLGLNLADDDSILSTATAIPLGGTGLGNGDFIGQAYTVNRPPPVASFNVVEPGADAASGRIFTKIAGQDLSVDIVALDGSNAVSAAFTGAVAVELVDNTSGAACTALPVIKTLANQTFVAGDNGRHPLSSGQFEAEARRNMKFRVKYPAGSPTITACSSDAFANRPASFTDVEARDQDPTSAGVLNLLANTSNPGTGLVHKAGRPFRVQGRAQNAVGSPTTLYSPDAGQPVAVLSRCGGGTPPMACRPIVPSDAVTFASWAAASGDISSTTANYNNIGSFDLELEDRTFSSVDASDGTADSVRYIRSSTPVTVGRFVPDHFSISAPSLTHRTDFAGCTDTFTYLGERMDVTFTLQARDFAGSVLVDYDAAKLAAFDLTAGNYDFAAIDTAGPTPFNVASLGPTGGPVWTAGAATVTAPIIINRPLAPGGPYAAMKIGVAPSDADGVSMQTFDLDADNSGSNERARIPLASDPQLRFGRLRMENAVGSEKLPLPIPMEAQYWNGTAFVRNGGDGCTRVARANFTLDGYTGNLAACETIVTPATVTFGGGVASINLSAPCTGAPCTGNNGTVRVTLNLGPATGARCDAVGGAEVAATSAAMSYLLGRWNDAADPDSNAATLYDDNASARAAFGLYGGQPNNFIYFRENY